MKIYSDFKDYYDSLQSKERDSISYIRKTQVVESYPKSIEVLIDLIPHLEGITYLHHSSEETRGIIGFCGKYYPYYLVEDWKTFPSQGKVHLYTEESILAYQKHLTKKNEPIKYHRFWGDKKTFSRATWKECLLSLNRTNDQIFRELDAPIFAASEVSHNKIMVIANPRLNLTEFQKVVDPYQAFQELSMFISSALAKQVDPIIPISDELKVQAHGMDRWSFRKMSKNSK